MVISTVYDDAGDFHQGIAVVQVDGKYGFYGFVDTKGNMVIPAVYENVWNFSQGLALVEDNGKYGYIDTKGNIAIPAVYGMAYDFSQGLALVYLNDKINGKCGFIDTKGNMVIQPVYDWAGDFSQGLAAVGVNGKYGYIDTKGNIVIPVVYDMAYNFSQGLAPVALNGKWGYIDMKGNIVISAIYDDAWGFSQGLAVVYINGKYGFIDTKGNMVIPVVYDMAYDFSDGLALVEVNGKLGFIDTKGTQYWEVAQSQTSSVPPAPTGVTATAGEGKITISWNAVSDATSYNIYWSTKSSVTKTTGTKITNVTSPYIHTGLTNGTIYYYIVTAVNFSGESVGSAQVSKVCSDGQGGLLTPARDIIGTWKTPFAVKFYIATDFCHSGQSTLVASQSRMITMIISGTSSESVVNVTVLHTESSLTLLDSSCTNTGYVPDVSPNYYTGKISGVNLTLYESSKVIGTFTFTTSLMGGTWNDAWCMGYCQTVYTHTNECKLLKE